MDDEEELKRREKKWYLDVENTPCARDALMHGIVGGLGTGVLYFLKSNVVRRSCDFAVGGFALVSLISWEICRMNRAKQRAEIKRTVQVLNKVTETRRQEMADRAHTTPDHPPPPSPPPSVSS